LLGPRRSDTTRVTRAARTRTLVGVSRRQGRRGAITLDRNNLLIDYWVRITGRLPEGPEEDTQRSRAIARWTLIVLGVLVAAGVGIVAVRAAFAPPARPALSAAQVPPKASAQDNTSSQPLTYGLPVVTLEEGRRQMQRRVDLPDPKTVGAPLAVMVSHGPKGANSLWIQYSKGFFLQIEPRHPGQGPGVFASNYVGLSMRHPDGTPYIRTERIAGRDTVIATAGELVAGKMPAQVIKANLVSWIENGYVYVLQPREPEVTLPMMLDVAAATP
jgi:hypothetical protein